MAFLHKHRLKAKAEINTGFGADVAAYGTRFLNKSGHPRVKKKGVDFLEKISWYHAMLALPKWKFLITIFSFYIVVNFFFACIYYVAGVEYLIGMKGITEVQKFEEAFFFSAQTFTTVGYGHVSPSGFLVSAIAAIEALVGLLSLALATGLLYGRFSKPIAFLKFSHNALIAPYKEGTALMLRIAPFKNIILTDAEAKLTLGIAMEENGKIANKFFNLDLELTKINMLTLSWTIVHPITPESPLYNFTKIDYENIRGEVIVFIKAFDDMFSNTVVARSSFIFKEIIYGAKFIPMYHTNGDNAETILDLNKLNSFTKNTEI